MTHEPAPSPASPAEPETAPGRLRGWLKRRRAETEQRWDKLYGDVQQHWLVTKVVLLHARYTFGYLAAGFLVSAPIQLGIEGRLGEWHITRSLLLGVICAVPFLVLWPFSRIDWSRMRLPEFKNLELGLTRYATYTALGFLLLCNLLRVLPEESTWRWLCDPRVAWINTMLMFFGWVRVKFHTVVFREFYTLESSDDLVLLPPSRPPGPPRREGGEEEPAPPPEPGPAQQPRPEAE